jgi:hypothetical protein
MGLQYDRLICEQLKEYYVTNFTEFRSMKSIIIELLRDKERFVISLHDSLKNELAKLPNTGGTVQSDIFEGELHRVFDERNTIREEQRRKHGEFFKPPEGELGFRADRFTADVLEQKLNLIEQELNKSGVIVNLVDSKVVFEDRPA